MCWGRLKILLWVWMSRRVFFFGGVEQPGIHPSFLGKAHWVRIVQQIKASCSFLRLADVFVRFSKDDQGQQ